MFSLTACLVQEKAELQAAAEAAQRQLEAAAEAAAGEREAACSSLLAELQVRLKGQSSPVSCLLPGCMPNALSHSPCRWSPMLYATPLLPALQNPKLFFLLSPVQVAYQQLEEAQASAAHAVTFKLTVAGTGVSPTHATAVTAKLAPSPAHQALESAVVAAAEALLALGCNVQQLEGVGCSPLAEVGSAFQTLWLLLASAQTNLSPNSTRSAGGCNVEQLGHDSGGSECLLGGVGSGLGWDCCGFKSLASLT